jgi:uncharacterized protein (UPF0147 family)
MFDKDRLLQPSEKATDPLDVERMEIDQLLELRARIQARLPMRLNEIDLEGELMLQYQQGRALLAKIINDSGTPANQKAQVQNSCASTLESLLKMQIALHTAERMKRIEQLLIKVVKTLPREQQEAFFAAYEKLNEEESS